MVTSPPDTVASPLEVTAVKVPAAGVVAPIVVPSMVPPFMSSVVTAPKSSQVAPAAVGDVEIVGEVRVLFVRVSVPATVATVPS